VLGFLAVLVWLGISMVRLTSDTYSTAMHLNMGIVYASLPLGAAISAAYVVIYLINVVRGKAVQEPAPSLLVD
jgi:TRAP-type C4-dicarboxylate transport system permease small subunit